MVFADKMTWSLPAAKMSNHNGIVVTIHPIRFDGRHKIEFSRRDCSRSRPALNRKLLWIFSGGVLIILALRQHGCKVSEPIPCSWTVFAYFTPNTSKIQPLSLESRLFCSNRTRYLIALIAFPWGLFNYKSGYYLDFSNLSKISEPAYFSQTEACRVHGPYSPLYKEVMISRISF